MLGEVSDTEGTGQKVPCKHGHHPEGYTTWYYRHSNVYGEIILQLWSSNKCKYDFTTYG